MRLQNFGGKTAALAVMVVLAAPFAAATAAARSHLPQISTHGPAFPHGSSIHGTSVRGTSGRGSSIYGSAIHGYGRTLRASWGSARHYRSGGLQCVPFARENTGIELAGNAATWWNNADGIYQRGARPEVGSILNFRANGRMRLGHVAVVSNVVDGRNIEIDHANWAGRGAGRGGVSRNITVVDVSPNNDWTAVRVELGHTGDFGSVYPTFGFIYDRPDNGTRVANTETAPISALNPAPADMRATMDRTQAGQDAEEVAEADDDVQPRLRRVARHGRGLATKSALTRVQSRAAAHAHHTPRRHT